MKAGQLHPFVLRVNSSLEHADMGNVATARVEELLSASDVNKVILAMGEAWMFLLIESRLMHQ